TCLLGRRLPLLPPPTSVPYTTLFRSLPKWLIPRPRRGGAPGTAGRADRRCAGAAGNPRAAWTIQSRRRRPEAAAGRRSGRGRDRSEEHTSELQSRENLVCRLLLEKKK